MGNSSESSNITNITDLGEDLLEDPNESPTSGDFHASLIYRFILHFVCLIADCFIIYAISRFKILKNHENTFILHRSVTNVVHILFQPVIHVVWLHMFDESYIPCYLMVTSSTLLVMTLFLPYGLFIDWVIRNFKYRYFESLEIYIKRYLIYFIYGFAVVEYLMEYISCHFEVFHILASSFEIIILCCVVLNIVKHRFCMRDAKSEQTVYATYVANAAIFSFLPMLVYHHLLNYLQLPKYINFIIDTRFVPELFAYANSPFILYILYRHNRDFNTAFVMIWRGILGKDTGDVRWTDMTADVTN